MYVRGIVGFAAKFCPATLPASLQGDWAFAASAQVVPIPKGDPRADELKHTLQMDFENYTLGRLCDDRGNYDMNHEGHKAAVAHVLAVTWNLGWRASAFETVDRSIAEDAYRGRGHRPLAERYGKKYSWIGFYTYAGLLEDSGRFPREGRPFTDVDIDPSFPDEPPVDGGGDVPSAWLSPEIESHDSWFCGGSTSVPPQILVRDKIGEHDGPWILVHGFLKAEDRLLGREAWSFISAMVVAKSDKADLVSALGGGTRPWVARDVPSDHYTFAGEIPWNPRFAASTLEESGPDGAYREEVRAGSNAVSVEVLAHDYAWESYHSELNRAGSARVPSRLFSSRFDLRSVPQGFDQCLPDGSRATITLSGVDGLEGDVLYIRKDLIRDYVGDRDVVWFAFGERELRPYPPSPPQWLLEAQRKQTNAWHEVLTDLGIRSPGDTDDDGF